MKELWLPVVGYEMEYSVSNLGRVRSKDRKTVDTLGRKRDFKGKLLNPTRDDDGYLVAHLSKQGVGKKIFVHKLVMEAFVSYCPVGKEIDHINEVRDDNRLSNLQYLTYSGNALKAAKNRSGVEAYQSKLSYQDIQSIKQEYIPRVVTMKQLAKKYNVTKGTIYNLLSGRTYKC